jgi:hypothetical protein
VEKYGQETVANELQRMAGIFPRENYLRNIGSNRAPEAFGGSQGSMGGGGAPNPDSNGDGAITVPELQSFMAALQAAGATPEDIAIVQQLIDAQTARA